MKVVNGGRDQLERDLACELFKPASNQERVAELISRGSRTLQINGLQSLASGKPRLIQGQSACSGGERHNLGTPFYSDRSTEQR